jgi:hypothetical protein
MVQCMLVSTARAVVVGRVRCNGRTEVSTPASFKTTTSAESEPLLGVMARATPVSGKKVLCTARESSAGQMAASTKETTSKTKSAATVSTDLTEGSDIWESGSTIYSTEKELSSLAMGKL